jgi:hypothetical protein
MANWLEAAFGIPDAAEPIAPPKPRQKPEVKYISVVVAQPGGAPGDLGETVDAWYFVEHGDVTLCDAKGKPLSSDDDRVRFRATLADGDDPRAVAYRLRRRAWLAENPRSAFDQPLYQDAAPYGGY